MKIDPAQHWQGSYEGKRIEGLSWTEDVPAASLELIDEAAVGTDAAIVDIGGGASRLARQLLDRGFADITVADISPKALEVARSELGAEAGAVSWTVADVRSHDFHRHFRLWHDRAVFHFMVESGDRDAYLANLRRCLEPGGYLVLATFSPNGPESCSGLPVKRYSAVEMLAELGTEFDLVASRLVIHITPGGNEQEFQYALFRRQHNDE